MAGADLETAGLEGERIVLGVSERSCRTVRYIHAVRVGDELQAYGRVLEIVLAFVLGHPRSLDPGELLLEVVPSAVEYGINHVLGLPGLKTVVLYVAEEKRHRFGYLLVGHRVEFDHLERHDLGPAVIEIEPSVIIHEEIGVTVAVAVKLAALFPYALLRVQAPVDVAVVHRAADELTVLLDHGHDSARIVRSIHIGPVPEIRRIPVSLPVGYEEIVVVLIDEDYRFAAPVCSLVADYDIQRVAES